MEQLEMPLGFGTALSQNPEALQKFALLGDAAKEEIIKNAHFVGSKEEMREYIEKIAELY